MAKVSVALFKEKGKVIAMTAGEVGVVTGGMIMAAKFLDFNTLFKNQIAKDPKYADKWFIKHQGAIKFIGGLAIAAFMPNPWLKLLFLGVAAEGLLRQVRVFSTMKDGTNWLDKIGKGANTGQNTSQIDQELRDAGLQAEREATMGIINPATSFPTSAGAINPSMEYVTSVGAWPPMINLSNPMQTYVGSLLPVVNQGMVN